MTVQAHVSVYPQVFAAHDYDMLGGLDVDHRSIAATFTDHQRLVQSLRQPYSARQSLNYVGSTITFRAPGAQVNGSTQNGASNIFMFKIRH